MAEEGMSNNKLWGWLSIEYIVGTVIAIVAVTTWAGVKDGKDTAQNVQIAKTSATQENVVLLLNANSMQTKENTVHIENMRDGFRKMQIEIRDNQRAIMETLRSHHEDH